MDRNLDPGLEHDTSDGAQRRPHPTELGRRHLALDDPLGSFAGSPPGWGPFGIFQEMGGLGSLIGAASVLMAAWAFSWTPASLNFVMSQGALSASLVPLLVGVFLWQSSAWNPHSHHLAYLKRCGLGMVLLALSMHLA